MILRRGRRMAPATARATTSGPGSGTRMPVVIGVRMKPGSTSTMAIWSRRSSRRSASERPRTPNFVPEYRALTPIPPAPDPMLTITPRPCRRMWGSAAWTQRAGASRLTATICCIILSRASMELPPPTPALLTSTSIRPYAAIVLSTSRSTSARSVTSVGGIEDAVVPQARRAVVGAAFNLVLLQRGPHKLFLLRGRHVLAAGAQVIQPHLQEHRGGLLAAHH